ncbi:MAG TPA: tape measure protein [Nitrososphaera sp.]|nr:tape measure protein [Nitrososphaera sp.]
MATDLERLVVQLSADVKRYENALNKAMGQTNRQARRIEQRFSKMNSAIGAQFTRLGAVAAGAFASGAALRGAQQLIDAATRIENSLKVAGLSGEELTKVYDSLFASAQRNAAPLEALTELYGRAALVQKELGISTEELLGFTDKVAVALRVSGKSAAESSGALLQLSQALGSGIVRAEEFNSILEGALPIAQAAAAGLKEAGGSVARLRQLVVDGAISSEAFFRAFEAGSVILTEKVANAELTVSQRFVRLQNVLIDAAGKLDNVTGASDKAGRAIDRLATAVQTIGEYFARVANGPLGTFIGKIGELDRMAERVAKTLYALGLNDNLVNAFNDIVAPTETKEVESDLQGLQRRLETLQAAAERNVELNISTDEVDREIADVQRRINALRAQLAGFGDGRGYVPGTPGDPNALAGQTSTSANSLFRNQVKPVTLADYELPPDPGGGGSKSTRERADEYERLSQRIAESTANIVAETEAMRGLDPLVEDYGYTLEKARATQELMNAALSSGKTITPELKAQIDTLAEGYANATVEAGRLAESQDKIRERAEDMRDFQKDLTRGIVDGFLEGRDAAEIFADALKKVGDRLLDMAFDSLFGGGSNSGFGILGALFGGGPKIPGFASGTNYAPGGLAVVGEKGPELVNLPRGSQVIPNHKLGGGASVTYAPTIDARGADSAAVARLEQVMAKDRAEFKAKVVSIVRNRGNERW